MEESKAKSGNERRMWEADLRRRDLVKNWMAWMDGFYAIPLLSQLVGWVGGISGWLSGYEWKLDLGSPSHIIQFVPAYKHNKDLVTFDPRVW